MAQVQAAQPSLCLKASSVANSDVPPQNATEQDQFLIPYEHSTAANTLLSLNLVRYFLEHRHKTQGNKKHSRQETGSQKARGSGRGGLSSMTPNSTVSHSFAYPRTYFFDIETKQPLPPQLDLIYGPGLSPAILPSSVLATSRPATLDGLAQNYFALVHPSAPLFSTAQFRQWSVRVCDPDADEKIETAMCLVVWALGSLAAPPLVSADKPPSLSPTSLHSAAQEQQQPAELDRFALSLFQPALKIIIHHALWEFGAASLTICQALLLAASDRAAELDIARSGIEPLADHMPLPTSLDPDDGDNMICFIAEIAARRLSNRIHSSLYATEGNDFGQGLFGMISDTDSSVSGRTTPGHKRKRADSDMPFEANVQAGSAGAGLGAGLGAGAISAQPDNSGIGKMLPISAELNRQLEAWYEAMPDNIRPPLLAGNRTGEVRARAFDLGSSDLAENDPQWHDMQQPQHTIHTLNERVQILRIHYYAARHIIHRPFVLGVAWQQQQHQQQQQQLSGRESVESSGHVSPPALPPFFSADALEKCVVCVDSCVSYLTHVLPLLERRSPYLWSFCQSSMACLLVLLVADSCPSIASRSTRMVAPPLGAARSVNIGLLRDQVAARLRLWATPGSSFDAELRIVESLPVELGYGRNDAWKSAKQERG
ncbi:hypothetical protein SCUCBS95973_006757 [Sporothrix curviconia]|uniref:C6 zinc finger domain containing protein n=1 Tax=Sporothrix curviconia TaxID=1260050 RepID=A0ABP0C7T0_9PEZI